MKFKIRDEFIDRINDCKDLTFECRTMFLTKTSLGLEKFSLSNSEKTTQVSQQAAEM